MEVKGDAAKKILERLKKGPARPKQLQDDLDLSHSTLFHNLKKDSILFKLDLIEQLDDGRYVARRNSSEETKFKGYYDLLRRKLLRNPSSEELAGQIQKTPAATKAILFKYIQGYREPTEEEIADSAKTLWKMLVSGSVKLPGKKSWFEEGIVKAIVEGVDRETLSEILDHKPPADLDKAKTYLEEFSQLKPKITEIKTGKEIVYKVVWREEIRDIFNEFRQWSQTTEILIPLKYDNESNYPFGGEYPWESFEISEDLAENYVLSPRVMVHFLKFVGLPRCESRVLATLKKFCQNAIEVGRLDDGTKENIALKLKEVVFVRDYKSLPRDYEKPSDAIQERNAAFDIIEFLDLRNKEVIDIARTYIDEVGDEESMEEPINGPDRYKVAIWLARDPQLKAEMMDKIDKKMQDPYYQRYSVTFTRLLEDIRKCRTS